MQPADLRERLRADISACGYFPELVEESVFLTLGDDEIISHLVHHEATFTHEEVHRHLTVLVLTASRLIVGHTDEVADPHGKVSPNQAISSTESVSLSHINAVSLTRVVHEADSYRSGTATAETWLTIGWGTMARLDLEPARCPDPHCEANHGYSGPLVRDDLTVRISAAGDGAERVKQLVSFGIALQHATGNRS
ncbi:MAG: DUF5998 family protein [Propionibacteriaceae bacterium]